MQVVYILSETISIVIKPVILGRKLFILVGKKYFLL